MQRRVLYYLNIKGVGSFHKSVLSIACISSVVYGPSPVVNELILSGVSSVSHFTNVFVSSIDFLIVSIDVSFICSKLILSISLMLNIIYFIIVRILF